MPFTVTHVAAVLPFAWLCRWRLPLSALAIGSMVPDVAGFYPYLFEHPSTHSFQGVFTHCVPLGLIVFYLFHLVLKRPLVDLLPRPLSSRLSQWSQTEAEIRPLRMMVVIGCLAFGALTHIVWDSFTHESGWGVAMFPSLQHRVINYGGRPITAYALFQHGSSLLLLPPLTLGFLWWAMHQPQTPASSSSQVSMPRSISWTAMAMMGIGAWIYFHSLQTHLVEATWVAALRTTVKHFGALTILVMLFYCLGMHVAWWYQSLRWERDRRGTEVEIPTDCRVDTAEQAHETLRPRLARGTQQGVTMADPGHLPLAPAPSGSPDSWS